MSLGEPVRFRWLGVAGIELSFTGYTLLIDPYFTRISLRQQFFRRIQPDLELVERYAPPANAVLVTHAHDDHLLDVPAIALRSGAGVYGSANTCRLCLVLGLPEGQVTLLEPGQTEVLGPFRVEAALSEHMHVPIYKPGPLPARLYPPLRAVDYRMDTNYSYRIEVNGLRLVTDPGSRPHDLPPFDGIFVLPYRKPGYYHALLHGRAVKWVIPNHWDDFWRPLSKPIVPQRTPPNMVWPPFKRIDLRAWKRRIEQENPEAKVLLPEIFKEYSLRGSA